MTKFVISISVLSLVAMVSVAHADTQGLAMSKQCFSCHTLAVQVGEAPAFKMIAEKYRGKANVEADLIQKIRIGGEGHWGSVPMPVTEGIRPDVSEAEAKELVDWILAQH
jgi:cytochrome c551/c552